MPPGIRHRARRTFDRRFGIPTSARPPLEEFAFGPEDELRQKWVLKHLQCTACGKPEISAENANFECVACGVVFQKSPRGRPIMLTPNMAEQFNIFPTDNVSAMGYDQDCLDLIRETAARGGMVLDCGAGAKSERHGNVVNLEIVDYPSTDVIAAAQALPFRDGSFSAALSIAVLEHVNDPFACARELLRVLKPGGTLFCSVPFLQPEHGYPDHYFNMTRSGLRQLFAGMATVERQFVPRVSHPAFTLQWILRQYAESLPSNASRKFRRMRIEEIIETDPHHWLTHPIGNLPEKAKWELASGTVAIVRKNSD